MSDRGQHSTSRAGSDLDPDVRRFIQSIGAAYARYPDFSQLPHATARKAAEEVRAPWAAGGPTMAATLDRTIPSRHGALRIRVHQPGTDAKRPALIYLHGGGWTLFSIDTHDRLMREYAARADVVVVGVDYALSPEAKFPTAIEQVVDAVRWIRHKGADLGIDSSRLALGGDSCGANLSIATALMLRDAGEGQAVRAVVLNYGAFDRSCSDESRRRYGGEGYMLGADEMDSFWRNYLRDEADAGNPLACPLHARLEGLPSTLLVIPECDLLTEQSFALERALRAAGVPVRAVEYKGASHSFLEAVSISALSDLALCDSASWLRETL